MAYQLTQDCIDMDVEMSASAHSVLVVLCRHANDAGECFPATALIAKKAHLNPRTVMQAVKELEQGAWISSTQAPGKRRRFLIDGAKIQSFVPSEGNSAPAESYTPAENCTTVKICSTPLQEVTGDPCKKLQGTPAGNCTRIEHIREQEKDREDSCSLPGLGEACPNNQGNPQNVGNPQNGGGVAPKMGVRGSPQNGGRNRNKNRKEQEEVADAPLALDPVSHSEPETVPTPQEPFSLKAEKPKEKKKKSEIDRPENVSELAWADWKIARESRRAGPITQTAWNFLVKEAEKAGITPAQAVELCAGRSWISFQAKYLREEDKPQKSQFEVSTERLAEIDNRFSVKAVR